MYMIYRFIFLLTISKIKEAAKYCNYSTADLLFLPLSDLVKTLQSSAIKLDVCKNNNTQTFLKEQQTVYLWRQVLSTHTTYTKCIHCPQLSF